MFRECPFVAEGFRSNGTILLAYASVDFDNDRKAFVDVVEKTETMYFRVREEQELIEMYLEQVADGTYEYKYGMSKKETKREMLIGKSFAETLEVEMDKLRTMLNLAVDSLSI